MATPDPSTVYNTVQAGAHRTDTPGLNSFVNAWANLQYFTSDWAQRAYNDSATLAELMREQYS